MGSQRAGHDRATEQQLNSNSRCREGNSHQVKRTGASNGRRRPGKGVQSTEASPRTQTSEGEAGVSSSSERRREWEASTSSDMSRSTLVLRDWAAGKSKGSRLSLAHFLSHPLIHLFTRAFSRHRAKCTEGRCAQGDRLHSEPHLYLEPASPSCPVSSSPTAGAPPEQLWGHQGQSQVLVKVSASQ